MAGTLDYSELSAIVEFIISQEKAVGHDYVLPNIFVETGSYKGQTAERLSSYFDIIYTIEADPLHFKKTLNKLPGNVRLMFGQSPVILQELAPLIECPCVFYLDAHWWAKGDMTRPELRGKTPLLDELKVIGPRIFIDLIIIDDSRLFGLVTTEAGDWSLVTEGRILEKIAYVKRYFEKRDRFVVLKQV